ncbi:hypothetical protein GP486_008037 [Trichoglossum hirsutum]|uniref:Uncharacterized protein n=1 Tax=Trichoglossum hirsutum TaxID=265104 RepID=A0A9P8IEE8_9PEZI|nr:hypothetical protein GP486_008037 [Trichoglossum hirsutum]
MGHHAWTISENQKEERLAWQPPVNEYVAACDGPTGDDDGDDDDGGDDVCDLGSVSGDNDVRILDVESENERRSWSRQNRAPLY